MPYRPDHLERFTTLTSIDAPRISRVIGWMIAIAIPLLTIVLLTVPWVQTAPGKGQVVALAPEDRVQDITALVTGRVEKWYVKDGQRVRRGDPIARIVDNDPELLARLAAERAQVEAQIFASEQAMAVARLDVTRSAQLLADGLAARRDYETAQIKVAEHGAKLAEARAKLSRVDVAINRQAAQLVRAPREGRVFSLNTAAAATLVNPGDRLAVLAPEDPRRVVELYIDGRDVALVRPGQRVRLNFEGWPAIQFSGWPSISQGMFDGQVRSIDPTAQQSGLFRVLVDPLPGHVAWPGANFIRLGSKVQGWIQMETVTIGYELWRQLNDFPLEFPVSGAAVKEAGTKKPSKSAYSEDEK